MLKWERWHNVEIAEYKSITFYLDTELTPSLEIKIDDMVARMKSYFVSCNAAKTFAEALITEIQGTD